MVEGNKAASIGDLLAPYAQRVEAGLARWLVEPGTPEPLAEVMRYCVLGGGKRLRPALVWMSAEACGAGGAGNEDLLARGAVAVELVHCYSLVHDDLPAMDDDALRRGRPTAHVKFGEAMAILAGDALLTRAFRVLTGTEDPDDALVGHSMVVDLAEAAGPAGMIAGQVADMELCDVPPGMDGVRHIHLHKTAALLRAAAKMGARCGGGTSDRQFEAVGRWAEALGLAFQMVDDLLDVTASAQQLGKTPGKDAGTGKRTAVAELGRDEAEALAEQLTRQAIDALAPLGDRAGKLRELTCLLVRRTH
jgi:geranylgeranyl pyrophosphate synthase